MTAVINGLGVICIDMGAVHVVLVVLVESVSTQPLHWSAYRSTCLPHMILRHQHLGIVRDTYLITI